MKRSSQLTVLSLHWCLCFCFGRHLACNTTSTFNILTWTHCGSHLSVSAIRFMENNPANQLRPGGLSTIIYKRGCLGFLNHQQYESHVPCRSSTTMHVPNLSVRDGTALYKTPAVAGQWWIWQNPRYDAGFQINLFNLFVYKPNKWQKSQKSIKIIKIQIWSKPPASWLFHIRHPFQIEPPPGEALHLSPSDLRFTRMLGLVVFNHHTGNLRCSYGFFFYS